MKDCQLLVVGLREWRQDQRLGCTRASDHMLMLAIIVAMLVALGHIGAKVVIRFLTGRCIVGACKRWQACIGQDESDHIYSSTLEISPR